MSKKEVRYVDMPVIVGRSASKKKRFLCSNGDQRDAIVMAVEGNFCGRCWEYYGKKPRPRRRES